MPRVEKKNNNIETSNSKQVVNKTLSHRLKIKQTYLHICTRGVKVCRMHAMET